MNDTEQLDDSYWQAIVNDLPELVDNQEGAAHLVYRFVGQYLPALGKAPTHEARDRVWMAFWSYLVAPSSRRKPFGLSHQAADRLIEQFQKALSEHA